MKKLMILALILCVFVRGDVLIYGGGDDDPDEPTAELNNEWVYGTIEYQHDLLTPRDYFMRLRAHPEAKVPNINGGYATTDVYVNVRLRGVSTPRELQTATDRHRPHIYLQRERQRWDLAMQYVWNLMQQNKTFRVGNFEVITADALLEADIEYLLGGMWVNLATTLVNDEIARTPQAEFEWDWGSRGIGPTNPNVPR